MGGILAIHGGAGVLSRERLDPEREAAARRALTACLAEGQAALARGRAALDVVEAAVRRLEDEPLFNAGRGSIPTVEGRVEMDASLMDGRARALGAVACVRELAHPISAARLVLEDGRHVLLVGDAAEAFARERGAEVAPNASFLVEASESPGTVGAVAQDAAGHLAAATSTGGIAGQLPGRVGDSPLAGAGTWADDATCAVSATGNGEALVRSAFAHEVHAGIALAGLPLAEACRRALSQVTALGRTAGCAAVDARGNVSLPFTSVGMYRGWAAAEGPVHVAVFADED